MTVDRCPAFHGDKLSMSVRCDQRKTTDMILCLRPAAIVLHPVVNCVAAQIYPRHCGSHCWCWPLGGACWMERQAAAQDGVGLGGDHYCCRDAHMRVHGARPLCTQQEWVSLICTALVACSTAGCVTCVAQEWVGGSAGFGGHLKHRACQGFEETVQPKLWLDLE